ncbi:hypothetical protein CKM354_001264800 [Cercospora kikuchii]|uniref:Ubiquitin-like-conjugating enzyme ATG10 n=1 Tax=Cercospora kikuchii TaxID=84275 RepID=A0A9P3FMD1_9PEZI|nr:uncharacterized protein CKM354_001264800 [Cercospora kikuchii]GIZ49619.1 hypothetical protein CKM354_001264800 [Cercospora kikuchii]
MEYNHFQSAIRDLSARWSRFQEGNLHSHAWQDVRLVKSWVQEGHFLRITSLIADANRRTRDTVIEDVEQTAAGRIPSDSAEDDDEEALPRPPAQRTSQSSTRLTYDIIHSPSYQVPVLYLSSEPLRSPEWLLECLYDPTAGIVGLRGTVSLTDHPETGRPVFFVHPCRTQEAMMDVLGGREDVDAVEWLFIWFGIIGSAAGLSVPTELAIAVQS